MRDLRQAKLDLIKVAWDREIGRVIKACIENKGRNKKFKGMLK